MIFYNGKSSDDLGVVVERYPARIMPERKRETVDIPGRNGALYFGEAAFYNVRQTYDIYIRATVTKVPRAARAVAEWLYKTDGYTRLEDDYDLDTYREAAYIGPLEVENMLNRYGRATLEFDCKPQRWLKAGETQIQLQSSGTVIENPTPFPARPLLYVAGSGAATVTFGGRTLQISNLPGSLYLDCEQQAAYYGTTNYNSRITAADGYPTLTAGHNAMTWTGGITAVTLTPRTWTI